MKTQAQGIGWRSYCCEPCGIGTTEILE